MNRLLMQLIMNMLLHQLGSGASVGSQGGRNPYANPFGGGTTRPHTAKETVIEVDAQVVDEAAGQTVQQAQGESTTPSAPALSGSRASHAPLVYEVLVTFAALAVFAVPLQLNPLLAVELSVLVLCALNDLRMGAVPIPALAVAALLAVILRLQALLAGGIASLIIVPAVAGLAFAVLIGAVALALNARFGARRTLMSVDDIAALPVFGLLVGYPFVIDLAVAWLLVFGLHQLAGKRTLPLMPFWVMATLVHWFAFGFLGLR